jgi:hypothetical protein
MNTVSYWQFDCNGLSNSQQISARIIVSSSPEAVEYDLASEDSILRENASLISEEKIETTQSRDPFQVQLMLACFCAQITLMDSYENWTCDALPTPIQSSPPSRPPDDSFDCGVESWILSADLTTNRLAKNFPIPTAADR